jgi:hypothetical protein
MNSSKVGVRTFDVANYLTEDKVQIVIKKHANRNEYFKVDNYWVRNFNRQHVAATDINVLYTEEETKELISNEVRNAKLNLPNIADEALSYKKLIVVSDGYDFNQHAEIFKKLSPDTCMITVNQAQRLWSTTAFPTFYLSVTTGENAASFLSEKQFPKLIASRRTNHHFLCHYKNLIYFYDPVPDETYQSRCAKESLLLIDDYRNPICACVGLANHFKVRSLYLAFCSHAFTEERPGTVKIEDGIYQYPQQVLADKLVDANLFWLKAANPAIQIYHTGIKKSFMFARYLEKDLFQKALYL